MSTQHCIQTVVGHRCEIWSISLVPLPLADLPAGGETTIRTQDYLILSGSSDEMIRGYLIHSLETNQISHEELSDEMDVLHYVGSLPSQGGEKCTGNGCLLLRLIRKRIGVPFPKWTTVSNFGTLQQES